MLKMARSYRCRTQPLETLHGRIENIEVLPWMPVLNRDQRRKVRKIIMKEDSKRPHVDSKLHLLLFGCTKLTDWRLL